MSSNSVRIAKNSIALYLRMLFSLAVSLYTSRVVLDVLGVTDYGVYNVVAGITVMLGFLNAAMASGTQRFLTFGLGKEDKSYLRRVFSMSINIHLGVVVIIVLLAETVGLWFLNAKLVIPPDRIIAANWIYQFTIFASVIAIVQVPYYATLIANEKFKAYAYIGIVEVSLKLVLVILLKWVRNFDLLILYGLFTTVVSLLIALYYFRYCLQRYEETRYRYLWDKEMFRELFSFSGWALLGNTSHLLMTQGMNILTNLFFGVSVNAARAITVQVDSAVSRFVQSFTTAIDPQIVKNYASNDIAAMKTLMFRGSKFSFIIIYVLTLPILLELDVLLNLWLTVVPEYTAIFIRFNLIITLIYSLSPSYLTAISATGNIRNYQLLIVLLVSLSFVATYLFLKYGYPPQITYIVYLGVAVIVLLFRITSVRVLLGFSMTEFFNNVFMKVFWVVIFSIPLPYIIRMYFDESVIRVVIISVVSFFSIVFLTYIFTFNKIERIFVKSKISIKYRRKFN